MTLISSLIIIAGRFIVKIFIKIFGWVIEVFFGRFPEEKNAQFSAVAVLSLVWIVVIIGFLIPSFTDAFYNYIPDEGIKNLVSLILESIGVILIPMAVGIICVVTMKLSLKESILKVAGYGYAVTAVMGLSMLMMFCIAPFVIGIRNLKRQKSTNLPVTVKKEQEDKVLMIIRNRLLEYGYQSMVKRVPVLFRLPKILLNRLLLKVFQVSGSGKKMILGNYFKIYLNPNDIIIIGKKNEIQHIKISISQILMKAEVNQTWSEEGQLCENQYIRIWNAYIKEEETDEETFSALQKIEERLNGLDIDYNEWEIIFREIYILKNEILLKENVQKT